MENRKLDNFLYVCLIQFHRSCQSSHNQLLLQICHNFYSYRSRVVDDLMEIDQKDALNAMDLHSFRSFWTFLWKTLPRAWSKFSGRICRLSNAFVVQASIASDVSRALYICMISFVVQEDVRIIATAMLYFVWLSNPVFDTEWQWCLREVVVWIDNVFVPVPKVSLYTNYSWQRNLQPIGLMSIVRSLGCCRLSNRVFCMTATETVLLIEATTVVVHNDDSGLISTICGLVVCVLSRYILAWSISIFVFKIVQRWFVSPSRQVLNKYRKLKEYMLGTATFLLSANISLQALFTGLCTRSTTLWPICAYVFCRLLKVVVGCYCCTLSHRNVGF
jgi:hypothetical protein